MEALVGALASDWNRDLDSDLAVEVRAITERNLNTYAGDDIRLEEDVRHETGVLEAAYRHRQVIELIQNGADALLETAGGRIEVRLERDVLYVANEGQPLNPSGLNSLLYFNLSEKKGKEIGRLGVGFKSVLEVTDRPFLLSRSVSLSFDRLRTSALLSEKLGRKVERVPVMRFAVPVDPFDVAAEFPVLESYLGWASTIVVLPLKPEVLDWLPDTLRSSDLRNEFLLFSPHVTSVVVDDRVSGIERTVLLARDGDDLVLEDDLAAEPSRWRVIDRTVLLSEAARHDGGERFERPEVDLAWALPIDVDGRPPREIWAFFPVASVSTPLPGILNSAWKLSEDRSNLVQGAFNEFLLEQAAALVIASVTSRLPEDRPGLALELLPPPPTVSGRGRSTETGWVGEYLQQAIWSEARMSSLVPSIDGSWHRGDALFLWPSWIRLPRMGRIQEMWLSAVKHPSRWVHQSVMTEVRVRRADHLGVSETTVKDWLEAVCGSDDQLADSRLALELVMEIWSREELETAHGESLSARVVLTDGGGWASIAECRFDDDAPPSTRPARGTRELVRNLHRRAGISVNVGERLVVELARRLASGLTVSADDLRSFWDAIHELGEARALKALESVSRLDRIPVRTAAGAFRTADMVLLPGAIVDPESDASCCVDPLFHAADGRLLERIGVTEVPGWTAVQKSEWNSPLGRYLDWCNREWRSMLQERSSRRPNSDTEVIEPVDQSRVASRWFPTHELVLKAAGDQGKANFSRHLMASDGWDASWVVRHRSGPYPPLEVPSPAAHLIRELGMLDSSQGLVTVAGAFGPAFSEWRDVLPVVQLSASAATALGLERSAEDVIRDRWSPELFERIAAEADVAEHAHAVGLLRFAAEQHCAPPEGFELPLLVDRVAQALELREQGERVWICAPDALRVWPPGWDFPELVRPPAEAIGDVEITTLEEYFPALAARLGDGSGQVWECDRVLLGGDDVDFGRRGDVFVVARCAPREQVLQWLAGELLHNASTEERSNLISHELAAGAAELVREVESQSDDVGRLVALLGEDGLVEACAGLVNWPVAGSPEDLASILLTLHGPATLQQVRRLLHPGLGVPTKWAGGERTLQFVRRLGFGDEFAGRRKAERLDAERASGPVVAGELHDFQREIADRVLEILEGQGRGIVDLPTGAGKTRVAIESLLDDAQRCGRLGTILWIAEREELCEQAVTQWLQLWRARGLVDRELTVLRYFGGRTPPAPPEDADTVVVASRQQVHGRTRDGREDWLSRASVVVIDEAHHSTARTYRQLIRWRKEQDERPFSVLGLSATPFRSTDEASADLARLFKKSLVTGSLMGRKWKRRIKWLQDERYLSKVHWKDLELGEVEPTEAEARYLMDQANLNTGVDQMNERLGLDDERNRQILGSIQELDPDWPVVVFAGSVMHAQRLAVMLNDWNISARPVWGELTQWSRRHAIEEFRSQRVRVLTNYNVLSEGFDAPSTRAVVIARLVQSDGLFLQMVGRGMRGPRNGGTDECLLVTTGERLPERFDAEGNLDVARHEYLWSPR